MLKAVREAKVHTSWINPNREYEDALCQFIRALLGDLDRGAFISDFLPFQRRVARFGLLNSLSQTALKFTVPGIPDTYQGNEVWTFRLVDPDNRQPIDYAERQRMLSALREATADATQLPEFVQDLFEHLDDGRSKLYVTWKTLTLRREHPELFRRGDYLGLEVSGTRADHVCAFLRRWQDRTAIVAAGRWFARLSGEAGEMPIGSAWSDTWIDLPADLELVHYTNIFTGQPLDPIREADKLRLPVHRVFAALPVAVLVS
jgi:(1->4)-alpha-D-glucan 1-alpha-D-glucosylmutase